MKARKEQKEERELIDNGIRDSYNIIDKLEEERLTHNEKIGSIQAKLGPIKYVTQILNVENKDMAVQIVIIMSMFTFDPFAIALLLAAMWSFKNATIRKQAEKKLFSRSNDQRNDLRDDSDLRATQETILHEETKVSKDKDTTQEKMVPKAPDQTPVPAAAPKKVKAKDAGRHGDLKWRKK